MGKRVNLASLAQTPVLDAPVPKPRPATPTSVPLESVAPNPLNPRDNLGDLTELAASLRAMGQLQPCTVVSRAAYLTCYPEHEQLIGTARYVGVTGGRRHAAAGQAGLPTLDIVHRDDLASSRQSLAAAAITENIERRDFDVLEEARAVQMLVELCGSGTAAAEKLARTKGWVSQRLALLRLSPEMQSLLRTGDLPVRDARRLAQLDPTEQLSTWEAERRAEKERRFTAVNDSTETPSVQGQVDTKANQTEPTPTSTPAKPVGTRRNPAAIIRSIASSPEELASVLRNALTPSDLNILVELLSSRD